MTTTSLKLPDQLKQRAAAAAAEQGLTPHAFMVQAIDQATAAAEQRARLIAEALAARDKTVKSGKGYEADQVHAYVRARLAGKKATRPKARTWRG